MMKKALGLCGAALVAMKVVAMPVGEERAERIARDILAKMTLEEKVSLCGACATMYLNAIPRVGIPREWAFSDSSHGLKPEHKRETWGYVKCDDRSTCLPAMSALAATWNRALAKAHGEVMGEQMRARGKDQMLGPAVNIMRNPISGRNWEYLSEDPFLAAELVRPLIAAVQDRGVVATVKHFCANSQELARFTQISTIDQETLEEIYLPAFAAAIRDAGALSVMSAYVRLNGVYCSENPWLLKTLLRDRWGFKGQVVTDWGGEHSCESAVLSGGGIECNYGRGVTYLTDFYHTKSSDTYPLATAVREGRVPPEVVDTMVYHTLFMMARTGFLSGEQPTGERLTPRHREIAQQIGEESMVLAKNDAKVLPLDKAKMKKIVVFGQIADLPVAHLGSSCETHPEFEITYLEGLKNYLGPEVKIENYPLGSEGCTEPLAINLLNLSTYDPNGKDAFIERAWERRQYRGGKELQLDYVRSTKVLWGTPTARRQAGDEFVWSSSVQIQETGVYDFIATQGDLSQISIVVDGREIVPWQAGSAKVSIELKKGTLVPIQFRLRLGSAENRASFGWIPPASRPAPLETLKETCLTADAVLVFTGTTLGFGRAKECEGEDRPDMKSLDGHDEAIETILSWDLPRTVIINRSGSPLEQPWEPKAKTYLYTSYLGQMAGAAFARVLFGEVNPSGKMPFTWPKTWSDTAIATLGPTTYNATNCVYLEGLFVGYRWYEKRGIPVQFPFGHGKSYTTFKYGEAKESDDGAARRISVSITNTGAREGAEVVQFYACASREDAIRRPKKGLVGFEKVFLNPGETKEVSAIVPRGRTILIGSSSVDIRARVE